MTVVPFPGIELSISRMLLHISLVLPAPPKYVSTLSIIPLSLLKCCFRWFQPCKTDAPLLAEPPPGRYPGGKPVKDSSHLHIAMLGRSARGRPSLLFLSNETVI